MNILFLTESDLSPMQGGTEHITLAVAEGLQRKGCGCFLAYGKECSLRPADSFAGKLKYTREEASVQLEEFIRNNNVCIVISNLVDITYKRWLLPVAYEVTCKTGARMLACFHAMPGEELLGNSPACCIYRIAHGGKLAANLKDLALRVAPSSFVRAVFRKYIRNRYRLLYDNCDRLVLLSSLFYQSFADLGEMEVDYKFTHVPNSLTYDTFLREEDIPSKRKEVMILARMDEKSKRISEALKIWQKVEQDGGHPDWCLTIVGGGQDLPYFKRIATRLGLQKVRFEGRQEDALQYYRRASIFMMTSAYEGWGLTLTESQQMGVVPLAWHSYASLPEIITDGKNGLIIPDGDRDEYYRKLTWLMDNPEKRYKMAVESIRSSHRFEAEKVTGMWMSLFEEILS